MGAEIPDGLSGAERKVAASTSHLPRRSTERELEHRRSAPVKGRATSVTTKSHQYVLEAKWRGTVHVPYVLIELPLSASSCRPACHVHLSNPVTDRMLTSAPVSTRNCRLVIVSQRKRRPLLWPTVVATTGGWRARFLDPEHGYLHCRAVLPNLQ